MLIRLAVILLAISAALFAAESSPKSIADATKGMKRIDGFLPLYWDTAEGKLFLEIPHLRTELLYTYSLPYGTGSNDLGLDRGMIDPSRIVRFERNGQKVFLVQPNEYFRSSATDAAEQLTIRQSFPESVLYGFKVVADNPGGEVLVDATGFFLRDALGVAEQIANTSKSAKSDQGSYSLDATVRQSTSTTPKASLRTPKSNRC